MKPKTCPRNPDALISSIELPQNVAQNLDRHCIYLSVKPEDPHTLRIAIAPVDEDRFQPVYTPNGTGPRIIFIPIPEEPHPV